MADVHPYPLSPDVLSFKINITEEPESDCEPSSTEGRQDATARRESLLGPAYHAKNKSVVSELFETDLFSRQSLELVPSDSVSLFFTGDDGESWLEAGDPDELSITDDLASDYPPRAESPASNYTAVDPEGAWSGSLKHLCKVIELHKTLADAEIISIQAYRQPGIIVHRFLIMELHRTGRKDVWVRLDRRAAPDTTAIGLVRTLGRTPANDTAVIAANREQLLVGQTPKLENDLRLSIPPTLDDLRHFLRALSEELVEYKAWPENCWLFASLIQQYFEDENEGTFVFGALQQPDLAQDVRQRVILRIRAIYHMPAHQTFTDLLLMFNRTILTTLSPRKGFLETLLQSMLRKSYKSGSLLSKATKTLANIVARLSRSAKHANSVETKFLHALILASNYDKLQVRKLKPSATTYTEPLMLHLQSLNQIFKSRLLSSRTIALHRIIAKRHPRHKEELASNLCDHAFSSAYVFGIDSSNETLPLPSGQNEAEYAFAFEEGVALYRDLYAQNPKEYKHRFAEALISFAGHLTADRVLEASYAYQEGIMLYRQLYAEDPMKYGGLLAGAMTTFGDHLFDTKYLDQACSMFNEGLSLYQKLYAEDPGMYEGALEWGLGREWTSYGLHLSAANRTDEATSAYKNGIPFFRKIYIKNPERNAGQLALALTSFGGHLFSAQCTEEASTAYEEGLSLYRKLYNQDPKKYGDGLAWALISFGKFLTLHRRSDDACDIWNEATTICRAVRQKSGDNSEVGPALGAAYNGYTAALARSSPFVEAFDPDRAKRIQRCCGRMLKMNSPSTSTESDQLTEPEDPSLQVREVTRLGLMTFKPHEKY